MLQRALVVLASIRWPAPHRFFSVLVPSADAASLRLAASIGGSASSPPCNDISAAACLCGRALVLPGRLLCFNVTAEAEPPPCNPQACRDPLDPAAVRARSRAGGAARSGRVGLAPRAAGAILPGAGRNPSRGRTAPPAQRARARPARNAVSPVAKDGGGRPARRGSGARFQQHPHGDHQLRGSRSAQVAGTEPAAPKFRGDHRRLRPRRAADAATPRVLAPTGALAARHRCQHRHRRTRQDAAPDARCGHGAFDHDRDRACRASWPTRR